ncbi:MAG: hypothetical protein ACRD9Q_01220 [Nitrososphaeraceae archaeon]
MNRHHHAPEVIYTFEKENKWDLKGLYKSNANTITVWLDELQTPHDLLDTLEHEAIHAALDSQDFIEEEEHVIIDKALWATWIV